MQFAPSKVMGLLSKANPGIHTVQSRADARACTQSSSWYAAEICTKTRYFCAFTPSPRPYVVYFPAALKRNQVLGIKRPRTISMYNRTGVLQQVPRALISWALISIAYTKNAFCLLAKPTLRRATPLVSTPGTHL